MTGVNDAPALAAARPAPLLHRRLGRSTIASIERYVNLGLERAELITP
jgi:hypothetical protein